MVSTIICLLIILWSGFNFYININHVSFSRALKEAEKVDYNDFRQLAFDGEVDSVYYQTNNQYMVFTLYNEDTKGLSIEDRQKYNYPISNYRVTYYPAGDTFRSEMLSYGVNLVLVNSGAWNYILRTVLSLIPSLVILIGWIWFMVYMTKNQFGSKEDDLIVVNSDTKFEDIIGHDELIEELKLITNLIKGSIKDSSLKVKVPKGILFSGPSGTGKTMLARAIANEAGVTFLQTSGSDFKEIYVGSGARKIRSIFKIAREHAPCIVFIDEIESIGTKRDSFKGNSEDTQTINALLKEMDGFNKDDNIFILAATNNPEKLDAAIKRSGRFDREIVVPPPRDWRVRKKLFLSYLKDNKISDDVDLDTLSKQIRGFTGADIANICNEAALFTLFDNREVITHNDIEKAIDVIMFKGSISKSEVNENDRTIVAYHEAGHAIVSLVCGLPISRASIKATTSGIGGAVFDEDNDSIFETKNTLKSRIMVAYGGRASEQIKFKDVTTGASNDITQATQLLKNYVGKYGFDKDFFGLVDVEVIGQTDLNDKFNDRLSFLSHSIFNNTVSLLTRNYTLVEKLANELLEKESLTGKQINDFLKDETIVYKDQIL